MPKRISHWLVFGWLIAGLLDPLFPHPENVYLCDPFSTAFLVSLGIAALTTGAQIGLQYLAAKKQKVANIDRGKVDDIRVSVPGYGEFIPKFWGLVRVAPVWVWESPAVDHPVTTPGQSGGKGPPKPPTATTIDHYYLKSVAGVFLDGPMYGGVRRIWFDNDLVASFLTSLDSTIYEAEYGVLSGGAAVAVQAECSGGKKVTGIGSGGLCTVTVSTLAGDYELAVHYTSSSALTYKVYVDGVLLGDLVCPSSGGATIVAIATYPTPITLTAADHLIRFENAGAACPDLDCVDLALAQSATAIDTRAFSSAIDVNKIPPTNQNHGWAYNNLMPDLGDGAGPGGDPGTPFQSFNLGKYGQPSIRIYRGSTTQDADTAIVAQEGAGSASAYRGWSYIMIEGIQLQAGRLPNVTLEVDQGVHSVPAIVTDIYGLVGRTASQLNVSALAGLSLGSSVIDPGTYSAVTYQNTANTTTGSGGAIHKTSGANHAWNAYAAGTTSVASGVNGAIRFTADVGPILVGMGTDSSPTLTTDVKAGVILNTTSYPSLETKNAIQFWNGTVQSPDIGIWAVGDLFQFEIRNGRFRVYQNGIEIQSFTPSVPVYPLFPQIMMYDTGAGVSALTVSTSGATGDSPSSNAGGLLLSSRRSAGDLLADLQTRFQFDMVEVDGVVKAILRSGSTADITIPYADMRAVIASPGSIPEIPPFDCEITDIDAVLLPGRVDVNYLDPGMDYHNNVQTEMVLSDSRYDQQSVSLPIVDSEDNMKKLAITLMHKAETESRGFAWQTSWKYTHVHPGSIVSLTLPNATHTVRVVQAKYQIPAGIIEFQGVRQAASLYSPSATGSVSAGYEAPIAPVPANTKGVIIDGPFLRAEDAGDGTEPVVYVAMCGRGAGAWPGGFTYKEFPIGSSNFELVTTASQASQIGVTLGALATVADPTVLDITNSLVINFYTNTTLSSVTEAELLANPELNLLAVINPSTNDVEYIQFSTAVAGTPVAPYVSKYTISDLFRGRVGTVDKVGTHTAADDVVVIDSTIKPRRMSFADVGQEIDFKFATSGQALVDAATVAQTLRGNSLRPAIMTEPTVTRDATGDYLIQAVGNPRATEEPATYVAEFWVDEDRTPITDLKLSLPMVTGITQAALMASTTGAWDDDEVMIITNHAFKNNVFAVSGPGAVGTSIQAIEETFQRFDFEMTCGIAMIGGISFPPAPSGFGGGFGVGLHMRANPDAPYPLPLAADCPMSVEWYIPTDYYDTYPEGTVREVWRTYSTILLTREGIDPGKNPCQIVGNEVVDLVAEQRPGPRYTVIANGKEIAAYQNFKPAGGNKHIVKIAIGDDDLFPLRLTTWCGSTDLYVRNIMYGGAMGKGTTILSVRDQIAAFGSAQEPIYIRLYQESRFAGIQGTPLDLVMPPP